MPHRSMCTHTSRVLSSTFTNSTTPLGIGTWQPESKTCWLESLISLFCRLLWIEWRLLVRLDQIIVVGHKNQINNTCLLSTLFIWHYESCVFWENNYIVQFIFYVYKVFIVLMCFKVGILHYIMYLFYHIIFVYGTGGLFYERLTLTKTQGISAEKQRDLGKQYTVTISLKHWTLETYSYMYSRRQDIHTLPYSCMTGIWVKIFISMRAATASPLSEVYCNCLELFVMEI